jgi:membrane-bound serine protease (ClpP class)
MDSVGIIVLLYLAGIVLISAELVLPSHGLLTIASLLCFGLAVFETFGHNRTLGAIAAIGCVVFVPTMLFLGIKFVTYLPMGNQFAPPNPTREEAGTAFDQSACEQFVGAKGRAVTPLRPVGVCEFNGRRVQCVSESGMIDVGQPVSGVGLQMNTLEVRLDDRRSA